MSNDPNTAAATAKSPNGPDTENIHPIGDAPALGPQPNIHPIGDTSSAPTPPPNIHPIGGGDSSPK
jgi:hypothetical protein